MTSERNRQRETKPAREASPGKLQDATGKDAEAPPRPEAQPDGDPGPAPKNC